MAVMCGVVKHGHNRIILILLYQFPLLDCVEFGNMNFEQCPTVQRHTNIAYNEF